LKCSSAASLTAEEAASPAEILEVVTAGAAPSSGAVTVQAEIVTAGTVTVESDEAGTEAAAEAAAAAARPRTAAARLEDAPPASTACPSTGGEDSWEAEKTRKRLLKKNCRKYSYGVGFRRKLIVDFRFRKY
jgi:hypothetical protein